MHRSEQDLFGILCLIFVLLFIYIATLTHDNDEHRNLYRIGWEGNCWELVEQWQKKQFIGRKRCMGRYSGSLVKRDW